MVNSKDTMMFSEYDDVVTVDDVMKMLHLGKNNVYKLLRDNSIKSVKVGKRFIIPKRSVIDFVTIQ